MVADMTIYKILLWALPTLLGILGFIGALAVKALLQMAADLNDIKISLKELQTNHDNISERVRHLEDKIFFKN